MPFSIRMSGVAKKRLAKLKNLDPTPLLAETERILFEDNRRRALAGLDRNNRPLRITRRERSPTLAHRLGTGPPLAPNRGQSRIVRLARTRSWVDSGGWHAQLGWNSFDSRRGEPILPLHAEGIPSRSGVVVRDVLGPTPTARRLARAALHAWIRTILARQ